MRDFNDIPRPVPQRTPEEITHIRDQWVDGVASPEEIIRKYFGAVHLQDLKRELKEEPGDDWEREVHGRLFRLLYQTAFMSPVFMFKLFGAWVNTPVKESKYVIAARKAKMKTVRPRPKVKRRIMHARKR